MGVKVKLFEIKHKIKWDSWVGGQYRKIVTWVGFKALQNGRKLLARGMDRCSWCGERCGFSSTISNKGMRCSSLNSDCTDKPEV